MNQEGEINFEDSVDELIFLLNKPEKEEKITVEEKKKNEEKLLLELNIHEKNV